MTPKRFLLLVTALFALASITLISTVSADPPPCLATNLIIEIQHDYQTQLALTWPSNSQTPAATVNWDELWCIMNLPPGDPSEICHLI